MNVQILLYSFNCSFVYILTYEKFEQCRFEESFGKGLMDQT